MAEKLNTNEKIELALENIGQYLKDALIVELVLQGHRASGDLINSIENRIIPMLSSVRLTGEFIFYGRFVETGRKAGVKKVPIEALEAWIRQKGFETDAKKVRGMAFAIQKTIFDKGISTAQSWSGEDTKGWMSKVLEASEPQISKDIEAAVDAEMELIIDNMITGAQELARTYGIAA